MKTLLPAKVLYALLSIFMLTHYSSVLATPIFFGPLHYLSIDDTPANFYQGNSPLYFDDLESYDPILNPFDGHLGNDLLTTGQLAGSNPINPGHSVDKDDGTIDGVPNGKYLVQAGLSELTFLNGTLPTAFGLVITGGNPFANVTFSIFDQLDNLLGSLVYSGAVFFNSSTESHRFVGVHSEKGIGRVEVDAATGVTYDHIQYGYMPTSVSPPTGDIPEPATWLMLITGLIFILYTRSKVHS